MSELTHFDGDGKAVDRFMVVTDVRLVHKAGGKSGEIGRPPAQPLGK